jgi:hypothetical protein
MQPRTIRVTQTRYGQYAWQGVCIGSSPRLSSATNCLKQDAIPAPSLHRFAARLLAVRQATSYGQIEGSDVLKMSQANHYPKCPLERPWKGFEMFLSTDDIVALHSQVSELHRAIVHQERVLAQLQRLGEPTALAEKFLARLQAQLAERQAHLDSLTNNAANENI